MLKTLKTSSISKNLSPTLAPNDKEGGEINAYKVRTRAMRLRETHIKQLESLSSYALVNPLSSKTPVHPSAWHPQALGACLEIGFGNGDLLLKLAQLNPSYAFVGCEVLLKGIAQVVRRLKENEISNIRLMAFDAMWLLERILPGSLEHIFIFFPDPWPKARHHKRRFLNAGNIQLLGRALHPGGCLWFASDVEDYVQQVLPLFRTAQWHTSCSPNGIPAHNASFSSSLAFPEEGLCTRYWNKAKEKGLNPRLFCFQKTKPSQE